MEEPIIKIKDLSVIYNEGRSNEVRALSDVNLEIFDKEYFILHGPSGCGKSTLLYAIAGLQVPTKGEITVIGKKINEMKKKEKVMLHREGIGLVFQSFYLIPSLSVIDNVCLPQAFRGESLHERRKKGIKLLQRFGIVEQAYKFPDQLSGGEKQRVAIARALINNPSIIIADEPTGNLDSEASYNLMVLIKELNEVDKKTIILVTHNVEYLHYGDRIVMMRDGRIISEEINREKRPPEAIKKDKEIIAEGISPELRILMKSFRNLTSQQIRGILIPFKSKQLLYHVLFGHAEDQVDVADGFLKELLFKNISLKEMKENLDKKFEDGGAGWDKRKVESFTRRVSGLLEQSDIIVNSPEKAPEELLKYLTSLFSLDLDEDLKRRFIDLLRRRILNGIDGQGLKRQFDLSRIGGGLGLYSGTAEKIAREIEVIMLMGYSSQ
jgi:putative ABC transport system ATP-binding protein